MAQESLALILGAGPGTAPAPKARPALSPYPSAAAHAGSWFVPESAPPGPAHPLPGAAKGVSAPSAHSVTHGAETATLEGPRLACHLLELLPLCLVQDGLDALLLPLPLRADGVPPLSHQRPHLRAVGLTSADPRPELFPLRVEGKTPLNGFSADLVEPVHLVLRQIKAVPKVQDPFHSRATRHGRFTPRTFLHLGGQSRREGHQNDGRAEARDVSHLLHGSPSLVRLMRGPDP